MSRTRRDFLRALAAGTGGLIVAPHMLEAMTGRSLTSLANMDQADGWDRVPEILRRIVPPTFAKRDFVITSYGAKGDGTTDCSKAFADAIGACNAAGGGRVVVPSGRFLTGAIHLRSNVNLYVSEGATIAFSRDPKAYLPVVSTRFEGMEVMSYSPLIYAYNQTNVGVSGPGTLDGQAGNDAWWPWKGSKEFGYKAGDPSQIAARAKLYTMMEQGTPVAERMLGEGSYFRPSFIEPHRCQNVLIEDVTIINSPMWELHPLLCTNVTVRGVKISSHGPNNDGCDPESCRDVLIEKCTIDTGDDCIAIKSGRNVDGRRVGVATENVVVRDCTMKDGHGGVTIGSEISGDVRWVFVEKCMMDSPHLDRVLRLKNNAARGGVLEHIYMRDVTVGQVVESVLSVDFNYEEGAKGKYTPIARDINMLRVTSKKSKYGLYLRGFENAPITDVKLTDCQFEDVAEGNVIENVKGLTYDHVTMNGKPL